MTLKASPSVDMWAPSFAQSGNQTGYPIWEDGVWDNNIWAPLPPIPLTVRPGYDDMTSVHNQFIYDAPANTGSGAIVTGLSYATSGVVSNFDWSGVALFNSSPGARSSLRCCVLVGAVASTRFAVCAIHAGVLAGDFVGFMNTDNTEVEVEIASVTTISGTDMKVVEFVRPITLAGDKLAIYPIVADPIEALGAQIIMITDDRRCLVNLFFAHTQTVTNIPSFSFTPSPYEAGIPISNDSGKPALLAYGGELVLLSAGQNQGVGGVSAPFYADEIDAIMAVQGEALVRKTAPRWITDVTNMVAVGEKNRTIAADKTTRTVVAK